MSEIEARARTRVEQDRHFACGPEGCVAPAPRKLGAGRQLGRCIPRRVWWVRTRNGAGQRVSMSFKTEIEALEASRKVDAARVLGQDYRPKGSTTPLFATVADEALELHASTRSIRPATVTNHRIFLRKHLIPAFGRLHVSPESFSRLELRRWIARARAVLSDSTLSASLPILSIILDYAVERGLLPANPMRGGEPMWKPKDRPVDIDPFSPAELRLVLAAARAIDPDYGTLYRVMAQTGLRPGEALGLRRCDLDLAGAFIQVRGTWSRERLGPPKTSSSFRRVSVLHPVAEDTAAWQPGAAGAETRQVLEGLRGLRVVSMDPEARLFPYTATTFARNWTRALIKAGLRYRRPHALRHSFASILLSRGANLLAIQKAGGWRSATVLLEVYARWIEEAASSLASKSQATDSKELVNLA